MDGQRERRDEPSATRADLTQCTLADEPSAGAHGHPGINGSSVPAPMLHDLYVG